MDDVRLYALAIYRRGERERENVACIIWTPLRPLEVHSITKATN